MPDLTHLPPPPPGKTGWPWTEETPPLPPTLPGGVPWPRISIVTPSYNQGQFIEETIRSVLLQGYPNLEYIIIDGGSTDESVEIIKKYEPWLAYWVSEPDRGQSHAINKGFERCTGEIMAWINSDDVYEPFALGNILRIFRENPEAKWVSGGTSYIYEDGSFKTKWVKHKHPDDIEYWFVGCLTLQQGVFWHRSLWELRGPIDETYQYSFDYDLWLKFAVIQAMPVWVDLPIARFRYHSNSKTFMDQSRFRQEDILIQKRNMVYLLTDDKKKNKALNYQKIFKVRKLLTETLSMDVDFPFQKRALLIGQVFLQHPWVLFRRFTYSKIKTYLKSRFWQR